MNSKLIPSDSEAGNRFGRSVEIDGNVIIVGLVADAEKGNESGLVHVYNRASDTWYLQTKFTPDNG